MARVLDDYARTDPNKSGGRGLLAWLREHPDVLRDLARHGRGHSAGTIMRWLRDEYGYRIGYSSMKAHMQEFDRIIALDKEINGGTD